MLCETLGAVAALEQESLAGADAGERLLQLARLTCKNQRREPSERALDLRQGGAVGVIRHLRDWLLPPAIRRPAVHLSLPSQRPCPARLRIGGRYTRGSR